MNEINDRENMWAWMNELFPICRSITGDGVRQTLAFIKNQLPNLQIHEVASGTKAFDWTVPDEWNISSARLEYEDGTIICDFADNNLHVVGYSEPVDLWLTLDDLQPHLHSRADVANAIPYITSYYQKTWGFCLPHSTRESLKPGRYRALINSKLKPGSMTYGELILPGTSAREIMFTSYVCHPSMANNELSGPVVLTALASWLSAQPHRHFTYRFVFGPETLGAIVYLSRHLEMLKKNLTAGFVVTCVGSELSPSMVHSRNSDTMADRVLRHVLSHVEEDHEEFSYLTHRGSDERQYCSPGIDLPFSVFLRGYYLNWQQYHTSLDNLDFVSQSSLENSLEILKGCVQVLEQNKIYACVHPCEPQLGKYGLYPLISTVESREATRHLVNILAYCDGTRDLLSIAELTGRPLQESSQIIDVLVEKNLIYELD